MRTGKTKILYCDCACADIVPGEVKEEVLKAVRLLDADLLAVADLCGMTAAKDERLARLAAEPALIVIACYPRAVKWLFHRAGMPFKGSNVELLNMRTQSARDIVERVSAVAGGAAKKHAGLIANEDNWVPWFPVIDYDRCKNCRQCLSFCLFGVYELSPEGKVIVTNPRGCKTNCSACARICPEVAIIFAKEKQSPVNGAQVMDEELERRKASAFKKEMSGGDMRAFLAERRKRAIARRLERESKTGGQEA